MTVPESAAAVCTCVENVQRYAAYLDNIMRDCEAHPYWPDRCRETYDQPQRQDRSDTHTCGLGAGHAGTHYCIHCRSEWTKPDAQLATALTQPESSDGVGGMSERLTESERAVFLEEISKSYTHGWNCARAELLPLLDAERQRGDDLEAALAVRDAQAALAERVRELCDEAEAGEGIVLFPGHRTYYTVETGRLRALLDPDAQGADE